MQCFIYKSLKKQQLYLYIENKDDFSRVPEDLLNSLGSLKLVINLELTPDRRLAKEDASKVMSSLRRKGYFIQLPPTSIPAPSKMQ